jgi:hypothetical protein
MPIKVQTPMGEYNPDWAIAKEEEGQGRLYLVSETKGSGPIGGAHWRHHRSRLALEHRRGYPMLGGMKSR